MLHLHGDWAQLFDGLSRQVRVTTGSKVSSLEPDGCTVKVNTEDAVLHARRVIVAAGSPTATRALLPSDPGWPEMGRPVTAACLDLGLLRVPSPGYALRVDEHVMAVVAGPPARLAGEGRAVVSSLRYEATDADADRRILDQHVARIGVRPSDIESSRFLARMVVTGSTPRARDGGLEGRPAVTDSGYAGILIAGDWVGPRPAGRRFDQQRLAGGPPSGPGSRAGSCPGGLTDQWAKPRTLRPGTAPPHRVGLPDGG